MEPIKTVSTTERIVRSGIVTAMVVVFASFIRLIRDVKQRMENSLPVMPAGLPLSARSSGSITTGVNGRGLGDSAR